MKESVHLVVSLLIVVPYLLTILLFSVAKMCGRSAVRSLRIAADVTVPLLVVSVSVLIQTIVEIHASVILIVGALLIGIVFTVAERLRSKEFRVKVMFRNLWRMLFLLLSLLYIVLLVGGLLKTVIEFIVK